MNCATLCSVCISFWVPFPFTHPVPGIRGSYFFLISIFSPPRTFCLLFFLRDRPLFLTSVFFPLQLTVFENLFFPPFVASRLLLRRAEPDPS